LPDSSCAGKKGKGKIGERGKGGELSIYWLLKRRSGKKEEEERSLRQPSDEREGKTRFTTEKRGREKEGVAIISTCGAWRGGGGKRGGQRSVVYTSHWSRSRRSDDQGGEGTDRSVLPLREHEKEGG